MNYIYIYIYTYLHFYQVNLKIYNSRWLCYLASSYITTDGRRINDIPNTTTLASLHSSSLRGLSFFLNNPHLHPNSERCTNAWDLPNEPFPYTATPPGHRCACCQQGICFQQRLMFSVNHRLTASHGHLTIPSLTAANRIVAVASRRRIVQTT
jgi:hypothetical protein